MSYRRATAWVTACDAPSCLAIVVPEIHKTTMYPSEHGSRHMTLNHNPEAHAAAHAAGWVRGPWPDFKDYCPGHAHLAPEQDPA